MQDLILSIEKHAELENVYIAHFEGAFDGHNKEPLAELEKMILEGKGLAFIFDFEKMNFLNSYAIGQLVAWHNHMMNAQGQIIISGPAKNVEDIFNIVGISNMFKIFPDLESAVNSLR